MKMEGAVGDALHVEDWPCTDGLLLAVGEELVQDLSRIRQESIVDAVHDLADLQQRPGTTGFRVSLAVSRRLHPVKRRSRETEDLDVGGGVLLAALKTHRHRRQISPQQMVRDVDKKDGGDLLLHQKVPQHLHLRPGTGQTVDPANLRVRGWHDEDVLVASNV